MLNTLLVSTGGWPFYYTCGLMKNVWKYPSPNQARAIGKQVKPRMQLNCKTFNWRKTMATLRMHFIDQCAFGILYPYRPHHFICKAQSAAKAAGSWERCEVVVPSKAALLSIMLLKFVAFLRRGRCFSVPPTPILNVFIFPFFPLEL